MHRVVIDSNVLISARLSPRGLPGRLLTAWLDGRFELITSPALIAELTGVLERSKFRRWLTVQEAHAFVDGLRAGATLMDDPPPQHHGLRDPDDSYLLTLARSANADYLVSGDRDLTSLRKPKPPIITPVDFLARVRSVIRRAGRRLATKCSLNGTYVSVEPFHLSATSMSACSRSTNASRPTTGASRLIASIAGAPPDLRRRHGSRLVSHR
jgi:uncharacterized protein